jgi:alpha-methylacyl-CoA racemase
VTGPLDGVRILDLTRLVPGGYATLLLADLGADVIKVEQPGRGDYLRWMPPLVDGEGAASRALNRSKRSLALDLKAEGGPEVLHRLTEGVDCVVESFRPGVLDRLGVGYETLAERNPRLVFCSVTGYGQDGPYRDRAGHDLNYVGHAGMLGAAGDPPPLPGVQVADFAGGMAAALGIVAALLEARRTGRGRVVDVGMLDVAVSWMPLLWGWALATGEPPPPGGTMLTGGLACYRVYRARDGRLLTVAAIEPAFWERLCEALGAPELVAMHLGPPEEQEAVASRLAEIFATRDRDEWLEALADLDACVGPVLDAVEAMEDPQVRHRGLVAEVGGRPIGPGPAIRVPGHRPAMRPAPGLGEHTDEVLREAGFDAREISALRAAGVVAS